MQALLLCGKHCTQWLMCRPIGAMQEYQPHPELSQAEAARLASLLHTLCPAVATLHLGFHLSSMMPSLQSWP